MIANSFSECFLLRILIISQIFNSLNTHRYFNGGSNRVTFLLKNPPKAVTIARFPKWGCRPMRAHWGYCKGFVSLRTSSLRFQALSVIWITHIVCIGTISPIHVDAVIYSIKFCFKMVLNSKLPYIFRPFPPATVTKTITTILRRTHGHVWPCSWMCVREKSWLTYYTL